MRVFISELHRQQNSSLILLMQSKYWFTALVLKLLIFKDKKVSTWRYLWLLLGRSAGAYLFAWINGSVVCLGICLLFVPMNVIQLQFRMFFIECWCCRNFMLVVFLILGLFFLLIHPKKPQYSRWYILIQLWIFSSFVIRCSVFTIFVNSDGYNDTPERDGTMVPTFSSWYISLMHWISTFHCVATLELYSYFDMNIWTIHLALNSLHNTTVCPTAIYSEFWTYCMSNPEQIVLCAVCTLFFCSLLKFVDAEHYAPKCCEVGKSYLANCQIWFG